MADFSFSDLSKHLSFGQFPSIGMPKNPASYGNWQTYAGMNPKAAGLQGAMANPASFSDFSDYAGMGSEAGIAPQQSPSPVAPTFAQVQERFGQVADQLKSGNVMDAMRTYQYGPKPISPNAPKQPQITTPTVPAQDDVMSMEFGG